MEGEENVTDASVTPEKESGRVVTMPTRGSKAEWPRWPKVNAGDRLPDGRRKQLLMKDPASLDAFRRRAAQIAVDMERGIYRKLRGKKAGQPWTGPYSRWQIAEDLGFNARSNSSLPKIFDSPEFERYVEFERMSRDASFRMSMKESMPILDGVISGFLLEAAKRVLLNPERIPDHVLFPELRKFVEMKGEYEGAFRARPDITLVINDFRNNLQALPEAARGKAMELFQNEVLRLTQGANDAMRIIDAETKEAAS